MLAALYAGASEQFFDEAFGRVTDQIPGILIPAMVGKFLGVFSMPIGCVSEIICHYEFICHCWSMLEGRP